MDPRELDPVPLQFGPKSSAPKTIGILNIVFGGLILMCGVCSNANFIIQAPLIAEQARVERQRNPQVPQPDIGKLVQSEELMQFLMIDVATGFVVNVLLIIAGAGLVGYREWGRRLSLWVAGLKIVRLIAIYAYFIFVVVPVLSQAFVSMVRDAAMQAGRNGPPGQKLPRPEELEQMGSVMGVMGAVFAVAMIVFGSIYPLVVLIVLNKADVKAACAPAPVDVPADDDYRR